jgi:CHAP domain-containing protein
VASRADVLRIAAGELGTSERPPGSNRQEYGAAYSMNGVAWCAEFVWWVFRAAGVALPLKTAYTPALAAGFQRLKRWLANTSPKVQPGDVVLFYWPNMGRIAHVGIVEKILASGDVQTIEGNTDAGGSRTGGQVMRRVRSRATVHRYGGFGVPDYEEGDMDTADKAALKKAVDNSAEAKKVGHQAKNAAKDAAAIAKETRELVKGLGAKIDRALAQRKS